MPRRRLADQTELVYAAENRCHMRGHYYRRLEDVEAWLKTVFRSRWFRRHWGWWTRGFCLHDGRGRRGWGRGWHDIDGICHIALPVLLRQELFILHELAHCLEPGEGHEAPFVSTHLQLVRQFMGWGAWAVLLDSHRACGVRHRRRALQED